MKNTGILCVISAVVSIGWVVEGWSAPAVPIAVTVALAVTLVVRLANAAEWIDTKLEGIAGDLETYAVYKRTLPGYRFVDVHRAVLMLTATIPGMERIDSQHMEDLSAILSKNFFVDCNRRIRKPEQASRQVGPGEEKFFPIDLFIAVRPDTEADVPAIFRVQYALSSGEIILEVAARQQDYAEEAIASLLRIASEQSVFRGHLLELAFQAEIRDEYGDVETTEMIDVRFKRRERVADEDIVLEDNLKRVVSRNTIDFHARRDALMKLGLPGKRGVLFYGPPGTGKTYMCKYLADHMPDATFLVCAGPSLEHIKSVCNVGRMLQPAVVLLEDVDLVFQRRNENIFGATLGQFMDELDGFASADKMLFVLTTNAIDRVEEAIKDRPGRISQCIYFGAPTDELRKRYLERHLRPYETSSLDVEALVGVTNGATQAFLKEYVFRAVQIASEASDADTPEALSLTNPHFDAALSEMRDKGGTPADAILGFRA